MINMRSLVATAAAVVISSLARPTCALASTDTITWGGDNSRTGYQTNHNMDPAVVGSSAFVQIFKTALPGNYNGQTEQIFSQPLVYTPTGSTTQYVYFATTQNNVYKLDAKTGVIVASTNLAIPFLTADLDGCVDISPQVGITATGVIDPATDTLYLTSKTYANQQGGNAAQGKPNGRYYLHALNVNDLTERPNFPVNLEGTVARNNPSRSFNGGIHHQRPALLQSGQFIYAGFASHCVQYNFTGWIMGWDKSTGATVERYAMEGAGVTNDIKGAGIWMSGGGLASDDAGSIFFATGNGYASQLSTIPVNGRNPPTALEEAAVHMTIQSDGSLNLNDFFMPAEKQAMDGGDRDLGTSPLEILPSQYSCGNYKRIGVVTAKTGKTYWLNLDDLGGYRTGLNSTDRIIQSYQNENSVYAGAGVYPLEGGYIYINVIQYPTHVFQFSCTNGVPAFTKVADTATNNGYTLGVGHGTTTSLNGQPGTGLLWTSDVQNQNLRIYNAVPNNGAMTMINSFVVPGTSKFTRPVFGDGTAYMGTVQGYVYGFGANTNRPLNCTTPINFGNASINAAGIPATVTCTANIAVTVNNVTVNSIDFSVGSTASTLVKGAKFQFTATFQPTSIGLRNGVAYVNTAAITGYSSQTPITLTGTGQSTQPLLSLSPTTLQFDNIVTGQSPGGTDRSVLFNNLGNSLLTVNSVQFGNSAAGPFAGSNTYGPFTFSNVPTSIAANSAATVDINFNPASSGNYTVFVQVATDGGTQILTVNASSGPAAKALVEFQSPDSLSWVPYVSGQNLTFGNVTEGTTRYLQLRVTNVGGNGAVNLDLTVSKPPFGVSGIIGANNQVDLAEGTVLAPGQSASATLYCTVPKVQWNTNPYSGAATWTMNTNDPNFDKQFIGFACNAVAEQAAPLASSGLGVYQYVGCYKENNPGRQLSKQLYGSATNTIAMCIAACAQGNYAYCGTQYNQECWAGPTIPVLQVTDSWCNFPCSGNISQICGGNGVSNSGAYISLFSNSLVGGAIAQQSGITTTTAATATSSGSSTATTATATVSSTPSATSGPVVNPGSNGFISMGCFTEAANGARALGTQVASDGTVNTCLQNCAKYTYVGLEYGGECWCGNTLAASSVSIAASQCNMVCRGNATEYCGAGQILEMYTKQAQGSGVTNLATSSTSTISSVSSISSSATSTSSNTTSSSSSISSTSASVTSASATFTTPSVVSTSTSTAVTSPAATSTTSGSITSTLTSSSTTATPSTSSTSTSTLSTSTTATSTSTTSTSTTSSTTSTSTASTDTFSTSASSTSTSSTSTSSTSTSSTSTSSTSTSSTSTSSTSTSSTGTSSTSTTPSSTSSTSTSSTSSPSTSSSSTSSSSTSSSSTSASSPSTSSTSSSSTITSSTSTSSTSTTSTSITTTSSTTVSPTTTSSTTSASAKPTAPIHVTSVISGTTTWNLQGCWTEATQGRALSLKSESITTMSIETCAAYCAGYSYFGVEYGAECYCGNSLAAGSIQATMGDCSIVCTGNQWQYCGGRSRLDLYMVGAAPGTSMPVSTTSTAPTTTSNPLGTSSSTTSTSTSTATSSTPSTTTAIASTSTSNTLSPSTTSSATSSTTTSSPAYTGPPVAYPGNANFAYMGCWSEPTNARLLISVVDNNSTVQTIERCLGICAKYTYVGVEYGSECWCGNTMNIGTGANAAVQKPATDCSFKCPGNSSELCGAGQRLNLYQKTVTASTMSKRLY